MDIQQNVDLKNYCTFRIGGPARFFAIPKSLADLKEAVSYAQKNELNLVFFGGGSNVLFPDEGINGLVIKNSLKGIGLESEGIIKVNSGETWLSVHKFCSNNNCYGLEAFSGLPGSIGGAVYGNAGAHGLEIKDVLKKVDCLDLNTNQVISIPVSELGLDYRTSKLKYEHNLIVVTAYFKISSDPNKQTGNPEEFAKFRKEKQPQGLTTGSFFKNPPGDYAGRLIDEAGLKGCRIGDIMVSDKHANFFLNLGKAKSADVLALKEKVQQEVEDKFGVKLEAEVQIIKAN